MASENEHVKAWRSPDGITILSYDVEVARQFTIGLLDVIRFTESKIGSSPFDEVMRAFLSKLYSETTDEEMVEVLASGRRTMRAAGDDPTQADIDTSMMDTWIAEGRRLERAAIVAWLRDQYKRGRAGEDVVWSAPADYWADAIERGDPSTRGDTPITPDEVRDALKVGAEERRAAEARTPHPGRFSGGSTRGDTGEAE